MKYAVEHGMIDMSSVLKQIEVEKRQELLKKHPYQIWQGKDGRYRTYITDGDKRKLIAKTKLTDIENLIIGCEKGDTFKKIYRDAIEEKARYIKNPQKLLSARNTINRMESDYKRFFKGMEIEDKEISDITKKDLEEICFYNLDRYDLKKKAFDGLIAIIRMVYKRAYEEYLVDDNTFLRMDLRKFKDMLIAPTDITKRCFSDTELQKLMSHLHEWQGLYPDYLPCYALELQIIMGLRRGEIPALSWDDIKDGYIELSKIQITVKDGDPEYFEIVNHTKTYKSRRYPLTDKLQEFLARLKRVHEKYNLNSMWLFPADTPTGVITNNTVYGFYRRSIVRLGFKQEKGITKGTHSFRRNAISKVVNAEGGSLELASRLFGNTPMVAENNYYTGLDMDKTRELLNKI